MSRKILNALTNGSYITVIFVIWKSITNSYANIVFLWILSSILIVIICLRLQSLISSAPVMVFMKGNPEVSFFNLLLVVFFIQLYAVYQGDRVTGQNSLETWYTQYLHSNPVLNNLDILCKLVRGTQQETLMKYLFERVYSF